MMRSTINGSVSSFHLISNIMRTHGTRFSGAYLEELYQKIESSFLVHRFGGSKFDKLKRLETFVNGYGFGECCRRKNHTKSSLSVSI